MSQSTAIDVLHAARALFQPGDVVEIRVPNAGRQKTISGYFDDLEKLAEAVAQLENAKHPGVYWTLNPVKRDLLARAANRVVPFAKYTTSDADIVARQWLLVDSDPNRAAGISAKNTEHDAALQLGGTIRDGLVADGWPEPIFADSGNGAHLLYPVELPNDPESAELLHRVLQALAARFNTDAVHVDEGVFNAARIAKTYATTARKGDNTPDRPHRISHILQIPALLTKVSHELLRSLADLAPAEKPRPASRPSARRSGAQFDLQQFLGRHGLRYRDPVQDSAGRKFVLEECPFDPSHKAPDAAVWELADGKLGFKCFHSSCDGRTWRDVRELFEPRRDRQQFSPPPPSEETPAAEEPRVEEVPLSAADVEAAIDAGIEKKDLLACLRMAPSVAKLPAASQLVIRTKLKIAFGSDFAAAAFDRVLREESDDPGQKISNAAPPGGSGDDEDKTDIPAGPDLRFFPLTDGGNGERIAALYGHGIRYCVEMKKWLVWDGKRWSVDEFNIMRQKGKEMARLLFLQAVKETSDSRRLALEKHARASESYTGISNALGQAATEKGIPISATELDLHPMLLNCLNGVVDLGTMKLLPHRREFLFTKLCEVKYDPAAKCPQFMAFLHWAMGAVEDRELSERTVRLVSFLQRAFGYALTGNVSTRVVFVFYGEGKNGKSTLLNLFRHLLGNDYSSQLLIDTVMSMKKQDATARADLADLRGARFVVTTEVEKEHRLNEGTIKSITAGIGSTIKSCRKYENPLEFVAQHKLFMDCNHRPKIAGVDKAIWDRLRLVPFDVRISDGDEDAKLPDRLRTELPGILAWAVRGCMAWKEHGLGNPPEVAEAGEAWRSHDDPLRDFLEDCCVIAAGGFVAVTDLAAAYDWWCKDNREKWPLGRMAFNEHLEAKKFWQSHSRRDKQTQKQFRTWEGLELKPEAMSAVRKSKGGATWPEEVPPLAGY